MNLVLFASLLLGGPSELPDTVVVCPHEFREALQPWVAHRVGQGHRIAFVSNAQSADEIRDKIRAHASSGKVRYCLLVGDAVSAAVHSVSGRLRCVPTHLAAAKVNVHWGSEREIATDNWYADLDDDQVPDIAVGRIPADTPAELTRIVRKILSYESKLDHGPWRRRVNLIAGVGGFGQLVDTVLESAAKRFIVSGVPSGYQTNMTYGSWQSPYCPDPRRFQQATLDRFNEGCLLWVYIGHGQRHFLDQVHVPGGRFPILDTETVQRMDAPNGAPIAIFLACYTGAFDDSRDCLAEEMLRAEGGPVAAYCGSRVTMPYAMAVMSNYMLDEFFSRRRDTLGDVVLAAKRRMVATEPDADDTQRQNRQLLDAIAKVISPSADLLDAERREHLHLFNLLGDPLLRVRHPEPVTISAEKTAYSGGSLKVAGECDLTGTCTVELVCRRGRIRFRAPARTDFDPSDSALTAYGKVYRAANDPRWSARQVKIEQGRFQTELPIPADAAGPCHVRVYVEGHDGFAMGIRDVHVRRPQ